MMCSFLYLLMTTLQQRHLATVTPTGKRTDLEHMRQCTEDSGPLLRSMWVPTNGKVHSREAEILLALKWMPSPPPNGNYSAGPQV